MAVYTPTTERFLVELDSNKEWWTTFYHPGNTVPVSGIYRCKGCGKEITSNKGDPFPSQNYEQHPLSKSSIQWQLIVRTDTDGNDCGTKK